MKSILIINSSPEPNKFILSLTAELSKSNHSFFLLDSKSALASEFKTFQGEAKKIFLGPEPGSSLKTGLFFSLWPFLLFINFFTLIFYKYKKQISTIICLNLNEKIIFTPLAKILKIKMVWYESPDIDYKEIPGLLRRLYRFLAKRAEIITVISHTKIQLKNSRIFTEKISCVPFGLKLAPLLHQDNIFQGLAKAQPSNFSRKYFTIGTAISLAGPNQIENLFMSAKKCLTVIPNLQLIVVSTDKEATSQADQGKNLNWLAKKIGIDNIVWFVSERARFKKWLDSFDIFIGTSEKSSLPDLEIVLLAMANSLPVIGFRNIGFEDMVLENKTGFLIEAGSSEALAQQIITLYKDKRLRTNLGKNGCEQVDKNFRLETIIKQFEKIIN